MDPLVCVLDDDQSVRESLLEMLEGLGFGVQVFPSPEDFLASDLVERTSCLVLDIVMPHMSGPDLQRELALRHRRIPIVYITGQADEGLRSRLLEEGAVECLWKPFSDAALLDALNVALRSS